MQTLTIVGAGVLGHACAAALREFGFTGGITVVGGERHRPYDRPPLRRGFLTGATTIGDLALDTPGHELDVKWQLGVAAADLDPATHRVTLVTGRTLDADAVVIATGAAARTLPALPRISALPSIPALPSGVHTLRTVEDALALREELLPGARMVVVGTGIGGLEVASTARGLGLHVTVLASTTDAPGTAPGTPFGGIVADAVVRLHTDAGTTVRPDLRVRELIGPGWVSGVRLTTGEEIGADVVLLDLGSVPSVGWLGESGLDLRGGVVCDGVGATGVPGVVAVGDCAAWLNPDTGQHRRIEHWSDSRNRAGIAMAALLGVDPGPAALPAVLTSPQAGKLVQFTGRVHGGERLTIEAGGVDTGDLLAVYSRGNQPVAVLGVNQPMRLADWQNRLAVAYAGPAVADAASTDAASTDAAIRDASAPG